MRRTIPFIGVVVLVLALAPAASATSGTLFVASDTTLTEDHNGSIVIAENNVTLDCAGFQVIGPDQLDGIHLQGRSGVTVQNCHVGGFLVGIKLDGSSGNYIIGNTSTGNDGNGIFLSDSSGNVVRDNASHDRRARGLQEGLRRFRVAPCPQVPGARDVGTIGAEGPDRLPEPCLLRHRSESVHRIPPRLPAPAGCPGARAGGKVSRVGP